MGSPVTVRTGRKRARRGDGMRERDKGRGRGVMEARNDPSVVPGVEKGRLLFRAWRILKALCIPLRHELAPTKVPRNDEVFPDVVGVAGWDEHNKGSEHYTLTPTYPPLRAASARRKRCLWRPQAASPVELSVTTAPSQPRLRAKGFSAGWGYHLRQQRGLSWHPLSRPDLGLMYKNKLVRRASCAPSPSRATPGYEPASLRMNLNIRACRANVISIPSPTSMSLLYVVETLYGRWRDVWNLHREEVLALTSTIGMQASCGLHTASFVTMLMEIISRKGRMCTVSRDTFSAKEYSAIQFSKWNYTSLYQNYSTESYIQDRMQTNAEIHQTVIISKCYLQKMQQQKIIQPQRYYFIRYQGNG